MVSVRKNQSQIWADKEFKQVLKKIKLERELEGRPVRNLAEITKEMMYTPSFKNVLQELKYNNPQPLKKMGTIRIKLDGGLF